ncbi:hypothetical protein NE857_10765 [Nocardiopsis exhalans]|uniref:Uncharacterized protein n=1 Tax=Nocardiopsis exhalans TaxID=163604 RepID=A0ABY5DG16_9ACTN|nr:hypothetical protein [Nocardiopsis exhalans]USY22046.1 hypothetical protein NE857_10765 [Nocardiopsis exhalans]
MSARKATQLSLQFQLAAAPATTPEMFHAHGEAVMRELLELERLNSDFTDSTVSTDAAERSITVEILLLDETDPTRVLGRGLDLVRTAIHAAGGSTRNWPVSPLPSKVNMATTQNLTPTG